VIATGRWIIISIVVAAAALAQRPAGPASQPGTRKGAVVLVKGPVDLGEKLEFQIDPDPDPRVLVIKGRRTPSANASFDVNGESWGTVAGFSAGPETFEAALPLAGTAANGRKIAFAIRPGSPGVTLDEVAVIPAARVRFVIRDQASKAAMPGEAAVESIDGKPAPPQGPFGGFPRERAAWISTDGNGDLYVPYGATVTFTARATPFRGTSRQRHAIDARENLLLTFLLPADQLPEGATILEGPLRPGIAPEVARAVDRARGIGKRPKDFRVVPAMDLMSNGLAVIEGALANPDVKFLATNEGDPRLFPPTGFMTVELPGGDLLHSNGPVILLVDRRREGSAVRAYVKIRLPEGVVADTLHVIAGKKRTEHPLKGGPTTVPLDVVVPAGTPIALLVTGPPVRVETPLDRAAAFRVFRAP
jgi:hypothetical protein